MMNSGDDKRSDTDRAYLFVLMGPSGVGKSLILHYMERRFEVESAAKYTTRPSRDTEDDARDFIFCGPDEFPASGVLRFDSYGHIFGIQLDEIDSSLRRGKCHAVVVGDSDVATQLAARYLDRVVTILVYCEVSILNARLLADSSPHRAGRWPRIREEIEAIYGQLGCVEFVINNSESLASTFLQVDRVWFWTKCGREGEGI